MANVVGTVQGVRLVQGSHQGPEASAQSGSVRKCYLVTVSTAIYTASADTVVVTGVGDRIGEHTRSGRTVTVRAGMAGPPGTDASGAAKYVSIGSAITNASGTLSFQIGGITTEANSSASRDLGLFVLVDEGVAS